MLPGDYDFSLSSAKLENKVNRMRHENVKIIKLVIVKTQVIILRCLKVYDEILLQTIHASKISRQFKHARAFCLYHSRLFNIILRCSKVYHENYCRLYMHKVSRQFEHARDHIYFFSLRYSNIQVKSY